MVVHFPVFLDHYPAFERNHELFREENVQIVVICIYDPHYFFGVRKAIVVAVKAEMEVQALRRRGHVEKDVAIHYFSAKHSSCHTIFFAKCDHTSRKASRTRSSPPSPTAGIGRTPGASRGEVACKAHPPSLRTNH